jgi:hypothetical protein
MPCCARPENHASKIASTVKHGFRGRVKYRGVKTETQSFYRVAVQRAVARVSASLDEALDLESLARSAALGAKATMLAIYHDDPETTAESALRSDAAIVIADGVTLPPGSSELRLPAGRYACTLSPSALRDPHLSKYLADSTRIRVHSVAVC